MATIEKRGNSYRITASCGYDVDGTQERPRTTCTTVSILILGRRLMLYSVPRYTFFLPFCWPQPEVMVTVMPKMPNWLRVSLTSSSFSGLIIISTFFVTSSSLKL